jgi:hypothetical protein
MEKGYWLMLILLERLMDYEPTMKTICTLNTGMGVIPRFYISLGVTIGCR